MLLSFQVLALPVLSISIAAIRGVGAKDKFFHIAAKIGNGRKQKNFSKADITLCAFATMRSADFCRMPHLVMHQHAQS